MGPKRPAWIVTATLVMFVPAASGQQATVGSQAKPVSPSFGTTAISYYRVGATEFSPNFSSGAYGSTWSFAPGAPYRRFPIDSNYFAAVPHLPDGVSLRSLELDDCDSNTENSHILLELLDCDYLGACSSQDLAFVSSENNEKGLECGFVGVDLSGLNYTVDNNHRQLLLAATLFSGDGTNQIAGAILGYSLQVSPAPPTPTFGDVPTTDFAYQYIEALSKSGITGGCQAAPALYCPDAPLTRRQMAVFLAKALGLQWP